MFEIQAKAPPNPAPADAGDCAAELIRYAAYNIPK